MFHFKQLTPEIRALMLEEVEHDIGQGTLYYSKRFTDQGIQDYPDLLRDAVNTGNDVTLGNSLQQKYRIATQETTKTGVKKVPFDAHETLAEGEFNRFYIRAICVWSMKHGKSLRVYRAKHVENARSASELKIGQSADPQQLLNDLRANPGVDTALGLPAGPNSGLSVEAV